MSEYTEVEQPFLQQLQTLSWTVIDQGREIPHDSGKNLRQTFRQVLLPDVFTRATLALVPTFYVGMQLETLCVILHLTAKASSKMRNLFSMIFYLVLTIILPLIDCDGRKASRPAFPRKTWERGECVLRLELAHGINRKISCIVGLTAKVPVKYNQTTKKETPHV